MERGGSGHADPQRTRIGMSRQSEPPKRRVDSEAKAGYLLLLMAITSFCTSCQRTVYIEEDDTQVCPVCSTPLLEVVPAMEGSSDTAPTDGSGGGATDHAGGAK
jgi:hypothetical protein